MQKKEIDDNFRDLVGVKLQLDDCLNGRVETGVDRAIIVKVMTLIATEIEIVRSKIHREGQEPSKQPTTPNPAGKWNGNLNYLIELIYLIERFIDGATLIAIQRCFGSCLKSVGFIFTLHFGIIQF